MEHGLQTRLLALVLALAVLFGGCSSGTAEAATMSLTRVEGTVDVADGDGVGLTPAAGLGLYSGYSLGTQAVSYAWLALDEAKLAKLDEESGAVIEKSGRKLELQVSRGSVFFNVTEPLAEDETMEIRTSTMLVGIRGTCGWVGREEVCILEGTVSVTALDTGKSVQATAGERAVLTTEADGSSTLTVEPFAVGEIPAFVMEELTQDEALAAEILENSGLDVLAAPAPTVEPLETAGPDAAGTPTPAAEVNFADYLGSYLCTESGVTLQVTERDGQYTLYTPRPGDPSHSDAYDLVILDGCFQHQDWRDGQTLLYLRPQAGSLLVESSGGEPYLDYLVGTYEPV